jgi:hypothetical protein
MEPQTFDKVWYLSGDSIWRIFRLFAYQDVGKLTVSDSQVEFKSNHLLTSCNRLDKDSLSRGGVN